MPKIVAEKINWIELGVKLFAKDGASAIVVDRMAKKLNCNRSSFYWHFESKQKFISEMINHWVETDTDLIINQVLKKKTTKEQFKMLVTIAYKFDPNVDFIFYLKRYAIKQKAIQKLIDEIDEQRIRFVLILLSKMGYSEEESLTKATIFYKHLIGYHEMIKYKKQSKNYVDDVYTELKHFIDLL